MKFLNVSAAKTPWELLDEITYASYASSRLRMTPEHAARLYPNAALLEARYQRETQPEAA
jgi:hypothetical protein